ncbi:MAG: lysophospholipid acyltransferase family protein [Bacillota bacterium]
MAYWLAWGLLQVLLPVLRRWKVEGAANLPAEGGVMVVANHQSYWDPLILGAALRRRVYFMAKEELFRIPVLGWVIRVWGAFPVRREGYDRKALKTAIDHLMRGHVVGIFPEGQRSHSGRLLPVQPGAAILALKTGVPVVPMALIGTRGICGKVKVRVGRPFYLTAKKEKPSREEIAAGGEKIVTEIAALLYGR